MAELTQRLVGDKSVLEAVGNMHRERFIADVGLSSFAVTSSAQWETDYNAKAVEMLAWHLYNGTSPNNHSKTQHGTGGNSGKIPIYAVVAQLYSDEK
ncbi:unnamed protein product, partial [Rhizoctonia solani]